MDNIQPDIQEDISEYMFSAGKIEVYKVSYKEDDNNIIEGIIIKKGDVAFSIDDSDSINIDGKNNVTIRAFNYNKFDEKLLDNQKVELITSTDIHGNMILEFSNPSDEINFEKNNSNDKVDINFDTNGMTMQ